jgi:hypothetical protein
MTTFSWTGSGGNDLWSNAGNWTPSGGPPVSNTDATLPANGESVVVGNGVNAAVRALTMGSQSTDANAPTLTVDNGRTLTINSTSEIASGTIDVQTGATMIWDSIGTFYDQGTIVIGEVINSNGGNGNLAIAGEIALNAGNVNSNTQNILYLGQSSAEFQTDSTGSITNSGTASSDELINAGVTISGAGTISVNDFDNFFGTVEASQTRGFALQISSPTFTNEGQMVAETTATLDFGSDGVSGSLTNTGTILLQENGDLAISGNYTISGSGAVDNVGYDGADISSDQRGAATFTNESNIDYSGSGQIGDQGLNGGIAPDDLTFDNDDGTVLVEGNGHNLTLNTGGNTITDNGGGVFLAENGGQMTIDSAVITGGAEFVFDGHEFGGGGTIEALDGGTVTISSAITPGSGAPPYGNGQILIAGGTVVMATAAADTTPINYSGPGGTLQLDSDLNTVGTIGGMGTDDIIDLRWVLPGDLGVVFNAGTLTLYVDAGGEMPGPRNTVAAFTLSGSYTSANFLVTSDGAGGVQIDYVNLPPPSGTTADMIMSDGSNSDYEIYDLGNNTVLAAYGLGQLGTQWQVAGLGGFDGTDTTDMILRNSSTGAFEVYDISNNNITNIAAMGQVGLEWQVAGFGDFSGIADETDMLMRNGSTGAFEVYDISNNAITFATGMGQVGTEWQVAGFGDFSGNVGETRDMLMRNGQTGAFEVYDITNNQITFASGMGQVGLEWQVAGFGDFSGNANETDMLMRNTNTGAFELYDITGNAIANAAPMGQVGLEWQVAGFGPIDGAGTSDMLMRNTNTGAFEVYDIADNQLTNAMSMGQVGNEWSVSGIAAEPASGSTPANAQLTQAMASYAPAGGALDNASPFAQTVTQPATGLPSLSNNQTHSIS